VVCTVVVIVGPGRSGGVEDHLAALGLEQVLLQARHVLLLFPLLLLLLLLHLLQQLGPVVPVVVVGQSGEKERRKEKAMSSVGRSTPDASVVVID
jgi:hypothetical protein